MVINLMETKAQGPRTFEGLIEASGHQKKKKKKKKTVPPGDTLSRTA